MAVAFGILYAIFVALFLGSALGGFGFMSFVWFVVLLLIYAAGSAIYFIYTWTKMRGSPGQRVLGLETLNAADGAVLTQPQAIRRWLFLFGPFVLAQTGSFMLGGLGSLVSLLVLGVRDLPALHRRQQPDPPGLPRRPGEHGRRQGRALGRPVPRSHDLAQQLDAPAIRPGRRRVGGRPVRPGAAPSRPPAATAAGTTRRCTSPSGAAGAIATDTLSRGLLVELVRERERARRLRPRSDRIRLGHADQRAPRRAGSRRPC